MDNKAHWEKVYGTKAPDAVSWYAPHLETSLNLIHQATSNKDASIIDIGGGEATLVDDLVSEGYTDISVLDISQKAIDVARERIGKSADKVLWYCADITQATLPQNNFDVWHDRAVFHFLTEEAQRVKYVEQVMRSVKHGGYVIMSTFGPEGPEKCSGLIATRSDAQGSH
ncbi:MAG TPA: class I SAM-dependent methyltransferase [Polynucleobacter sp.]|jgi:SAM-dependent methyltransferase|nr:MAG: SAM-dependent methyltransferase [Polynucleobacter sp. 16-46-70]HQR84978.1 class I SAM-dependent methyltransferase [Polynucleobacter sp.]HQT21369.1 class I SAM-dependent methyltransferase [Polynucleobacter sp.]HQT41070.1 class I SAM-dependent methyltransferase [Polynucleobacter sp.]